MYVRKEALLSSQIEGTQATLDDILDPNIEQNINQNVAEVINYIKANEYAIELLNDLPVCNRLFRGTHLVLMDGIRGSEKNPGEFRNSQNWIGGQGSTIQNARYIPPNVEDMLEAMGQLEQFINQPDNMDILVRIALIHYQFETIHPFLDGNGRIGRLMVNLLLRESGILTRPILYISYFLKRNRIEYYDRLTEVREKGSFEQWVKFFLQGLYESAEDAILSIDRLTALHEQNIAIVKQNDSRTGILEKLFLFLEQTPIINIGKTAKALSVSFSTLSSAVEKLISLSILEQSGTGKRDRRFSYEVYLSILRKDT
jgi:Fic family protein